MIDWTKPLELMDGTPVRLVHSDHYALEPWGGCQPDNGGHWWVEREDGLRFVDGVHTICGDDSGFSFGNKVRNRAEPETVTPDEIPEWIKVGEIAKSSVTLRDRFAMAAIPYCVGGCNPSEIAEEAYAIADAMMAARNG